MELTGEHRIPARREVVWAGLNDPDVLRDSIPGCQSLEKVSDEELTAKVAVKIGPVKATMAGKVTLSDINAPSSYKISGEGRGAAAGFARGTADVNLEEDGEETVLKYAAQAQVGGKLAQLGARLVLPAAQELAEKFFTAFSERVAGGPATTDEPAEAEPSDDAETSASADDDARAAIEGTSDDDAPEEVEAPEAEAEPEPAARDDVITRVEHAAEEAVHQAADVAHHAEEEIDAAASRNFLGGPPMWALIVFAIVVLALLANRLF